MSVTGVLLGVTSISNTKEGENMKRKDELTKVFEDVDDSVKAVITPLIDDVVFLEDKLKELRKLPFIEVSTKNAARQRNTPASKMYKELLQQYNNCIKILCGVLGKNADGETSPLQDYLKSLGGKYED